MLREELMIIGPAKAYNYMVAKENQSRRSRHAERREKDEVRKNARYLPQ